MAISNDEKLARFLYEEECRAAGQEIPLVPWINWEWKDRFLRFARNIRKFAAEHKL